MRAPHPLKALFVAIPALALIAALQACQREGGPPPGLAVSTPALPRAHEGASYSATLAAANGTPPYTWRLASGSLPAGLSLSAAGVIAGTPAAQGPASFTVTVTDAASTAAARAFSLSVQPPLPVIATTSAPSGNVGSVYALDLAGSQGTPPYTWSLASGPLPPGLSLSSLGQVRGIPTTLGTWTVSVQLVDAAGAPSATARTLDIAIGPPVLVVATAALPDAKLGLRYSYYLRAEHGQLPYTWALAGGGQAPAGLSLAASTGELSGTPTQAGTHELDVEVTDSSGTPATAGRTFSLLAVLPDGNVGDAYSQSVAEARIQGPFTWTLTSGSLPPGLTLDATAGTVSGTPTASGIYPVTLQAVNAASQSRSQRHTITVRTSSTVLSGKVTYEKWTTSAFTGLNNGTPSVTVPVRYADIEVVDASTTLVEAVTATDANGDYSLIVPQHTPYYVRAIARTTQTSGLDLEVRTGPGGLLYAITGPVFTAVTAQQTMDLHEAATTTGNPALIAGAFNIFAVTIKEFEFVATVNPARPPHLEVQWSLGNGLSTSSFGSVGGTSGGPSFEIQGGQPGAEDRTDTDMFDDAVIGHEACHFLQWALSVDASFGGSHTTGDILVPGLAYSEGLANFVGCVIQGDPVYRETFGYGPTSTVATWDAEHSIQTHRGSTNEDDVGGLLWDIYDGVNGYADADGDGLSLAAAQTMGPAFAYERTVDWPAVNTHLQALVDGGFLSDAQIAALLVAPQDRNIAWPPVSYPDAFPVDLAVNGAAYSGTASALGRIAGGAGDNYGGTHPATMVHAFRVASTAQHTVTLTIHGADPADANDLDLYLLRPTAGGDLLVVGQSTSLNAVETIRRTLQPGLYVVEVDAWSNTQGVVHEASGDYTLQVTRP